jgi:hypothetical protein
MRDLETQKVYSVKSNSSVLWWVIRSLPNINLIWSPNTETIINLIEYGKSFNEVSTFVFIQPQIDLKRLESVTYAEDNYYFLLLTEATGEFKDKGEKIYKSLSHSPFQQLDLSKYNLLQDEYLLDKANQHGLSSDNFIKLVEDFNNPFRLLWQLNLQPELIMDYETPNIERQAIPLIKSLLTHEGIVKWGALTKKEAYTLFLPNNPSISPMYQILTGANKKYNGICPQLWVYLDIFMDALLPTYEHNPQYILSLFATWVRLTSTIWADRYNKGFVEVISRNMNFYNFQPSTEAHTELKSFLNN